MKKFDEAARLWEQARYICTYVALLTCTYTVESLNGGHFVGASFVLCKDIVLFRRFKCM